MSDLDPYNHVNNGSQCHYFDMGRSRFFEHTLNEEIDWLTFKYVLVHVDLDFKMPVLFHDELVCESCITEVGNSSFKMLQRLVDKRTGAEKTLCHAVVVYFDREANKSERIPDEDREKLLTMKMVYSC
ncbi:MAG: thioesterase family protein [Bacteroidales bacterium]|nr:thioesterase family protein [Bacteroidales bacterium]